MRRLRIAAAGRALADTLVQRTEGWSGRTIACRRSGAEPASRVERDPQRLLDQVFRAARERLSARAMRCSSPGMQPGRRSVTNHPGLVPPRRPQLGRLRSTGSRWPTRRCARGRRIDSSIPREIPLAIGLLTQGPRIHSGLLVPVASLTPALRWLLSPTAGAHPGSTNRRGLLSLCRAGRPDLREQRALPQHQRSAQALERRRSSAAGEQNAARERAALSPARRSVQEIFYLVDAS